MATADQRALIGRERELALIDEHLAAARSGAGAALMFVGEPGSGKTSLVHAARVRASDFTILSCEGVGWEAELPYSALHALLRPLLGSLPALPDLQREALESALGIVAPRGQVALQLYAGAHSLITEATRERPVLLLVDDLQWIDDASARVLSFVARRLGGDAVGMVIASRPGTGFPGLESAVIDLPPLDAAAVAELASRALGKALPDRAVSDLARASSGNPLAIVECVGHFGDELWLRGTMLDGPLPVGRLIERGFQDRLEALSSDARAALELVAASVGDETALIGAALDLIGAGAGLREAERAGVIAFQGTRCQFVHPLLRSLVHRKADPQSLRRCHAAHAEVVSDPDLRAWHRASSVVEADAEIADALDTAAQRFVDRGGMLAAAQALARSAELTADADGRADRLTRAGVAAQHSGNVAWAEECFAEAFRVAQSPRIRVNAEFRRASLSSHLVPGQDNSARLMAVAQRAHGVDDNLAAFALTAAAQEAVLDGQPRGIDNAVTRMQELLETGELSTVRRTDLAVLIAYMAVLRGSIHDPDGVLETLRRAAAHPFPPNEIGHLVQALVWVEEYPLARRLSDEAIALSKEQGDSHTLAVSLVFSGLVDVRIGAWGAARDQFGASARVLESSDLDSYSAGLLSKRLVIDAAQGRPDIVGSCREMLQVGKAYGVDVVMESTAAALGHADLVAGRAGQAVRHLEEVRDWKRNAGQVEPCEWTWPADLVEAYLLVGDRASAEAALEDLRAFACASRRRWAGAAVARLEAFIAAEDEFEARFAVALGLYERAHDPFGRARAQLGFGRRLRRARRAAEARTQFEAALAEFERLGAAPWAQQTRQELGIGGPQAGCGGTVDRDALTPQEQQVATLVVAGFSNKEVAGALFLSPKTIEAHLSRIYRKLGVTSRTQLAVKLGGVREVEGSP